MTEMIDRVARAIDALIREPCTLTFGEIARVAIEAMKEPTSAMIRSAEACSGSCYTCNRNWYQDPAATWAHMIDIALSGDE